MYFESFKIFETTNQNEIELFVCANNQYQYFHAMDENSFTFGRIRSNFLTWLDFADEQTRRMLVDLNIVAMERYKNAT